MTVIQRKMTQVKPFFKLRTAKAKDVNYIKKLIYGLIYNESIEFYLRIIVSKFFFVFIIAFILKLIHLHSGITIFDVIFTIIVVVYLIRSLFFLFHPFYSPVNWKKYKLIESDRGLIVGCTAIDYYKHCSILGNLYVKKAWRKRGLGSALLKFSIKKIDRPIYLVSKKKNINFYKRNGFILVSWEDLPSTVKASFKIYQPHPRLWGYPLCFMQYKGHNTVGFTYEI